MSEKIKPKKKSKISKWELIILLLVLLGIYFKFKYLIEEEINHTILIAEPKEK